MKQSSPRRAKAITPQATAEKLAKAHRRADPKTRIIKYFPGAQMDSVCLLEVSDSAPTTGEVIPFAFQADAKHKINYQSVVILLSPDEWRSVQTHKLDLPPGWDLAKAMEL